MPLTEQERTDIEALLQRGAATIAAYPTAAIELDPVLNRLRRILWTDTEITAVTALVERNWEQMVKNGAFWKDRRRKLASGNYCRCPGSRHIQRKPKASRPKCGAHTRKGTPCMAPVVFGRNRCRLHGGKSTGPVSVEGRARIAEAQRKRWERYRSEKR